MSEEKGPKGINKAESETLGLDRSQANNEDGRANNDAMRMERSVEDKDVTTCLKYLRDFQ